MNAGNKKIIVIVGPTASGKTGLSIKLAKKFNGEIISADSRQVYKQMDIGTAKITKKEMEGVPHYLLDVASPKKKFTAAQYRKLGMKALNTIFKAKSPQAFLVGFLPSSNLPLNSIFRVMRKLFIIILLIYNCWYCIPLCLHM